MAGLPPNSEFCLGSQGLHTHVPLSVGRFQAGGALTAAMMVFLPAWPFS